jgi:NAD(P)-dependent dehydrogenase (short-subunit alcohol dehydrogenase family)
MNSSFEMSSLGDGYRALVIGASGALGAAFCELFREDPCCSIVRELGRNSVPELDLEAPDSIARAAAELAEEAPYQLILHAAGLLHRDEIKRHRHFGPLTTLSWRLRSQAGKRCCP